jgi:asparagine synthetase B (glutamine-hydrolysing)
MHVKGFNPPSEEEIEYFGLYYACQRSSGEFSLYENGEFAARGRVGLSPLYWNRELGLFSFKPGTNLEEFPAGHLYNFENDRIVCWDPIYFDKPMKTLPCAVRDVRILLSKAINSYKYDAFIMSSGCGSRMISDYLENVPAYTNGTKYIYDTENKYVDF